MELQAVTPPSPFSDDTNLFQNFENGLINVKKVGVFEGIYYVLVQ